MKVGDKITIKDGSELYRGTIVDFSYVGYYIFVDSYNDPTNKKYWPIPKSKVQVFEEGLYIYLR